MKWVQVGILVALIVVAVLLFQIYRSGQRQTQPAAAAMPEPPQAAAPPVAGETSPPAATQLAPPPTATKLESRPAPARKVRSTEPKAQAPALTPETPEAEQRVPEAAPPAPAPPAPAPEPAPMAQSREFEPSIARAPAAPRTVTIAAGTLLSVRLAETLSSDRLKEGEGFMATLDRPLIVDGLVIAERGARVEGRVVEARQAGRVRGVSSLAIQLTRITTSDGQRVEIETDPFRKEAETTRSEDAVKVGGGAGLGAAIGAIAGGGKGAAIGAAIGAAAGAGTVAATRGKAAVLPVETRLDFRLSRPVTVTERK